jgi:hypothetical protein
MNRRRTAAACGFLAGFILLSLLHEAGHLLVGWATGSEVWEVTFLRRKVFPFTLEPVEVPALYRITFGAPPNPLAEGLRLAGGCGATLSVAFASLLLRKRPAHPFLRGFLLAISLGGFDLVTYAWIPPLGLPRWILFGARHSEPAAAAARLGIPPLFLHLGVACIALGTISVALRSLRSDCGR